MKENVDFTCLKMVLIIHKVCHAKSRRRILLRTVTSNRTCFPNMDQQHQVHQGNLPILLLYFKEVSFDLLDNSPKWRSLTKFFRKCSIWNDWVSSGSMTPRFDCANEDLLFLYAGNILNFSVGADVDLNRPRSFWTRLAGKYSNKFYWQEMVLSFNDLLGCRRELRSPIARRQCRKNLALLFLVFSHVVSCFRCYDPQIFVKTLSCCC